MKIGKLKRDILKTANNIAKPSKFQLGVPVLGVLLGIIIAFKIF